MPEEYKETAEQTELADNFMMCAEMDGIEIVVPETDKEDE